MPAAALGESQYFCGAFASKICDKEHSTTTLGDSEVARVQDSPRNVTRPDVCQRVDDRSKVSPTVAGEGSGDVFPDGEVGLAVGFTKLANNSNCCMEEAAPFAGEASTLASHREVLAGTTERHHVHRLQVVCADLGHIVVVRRVREAQPQHRLGLCVDLASPLGGEPRALKAEVEPTDAREQRPEGEHHLPCSARCLSA